MSRKKTTAQIPYYVRMRDEDRHLLIKQNEATFSLLFKVIITFSAAAIGTSSLTRFAEIANKNFLYLGWLFLFVSIICITSELILSAYRTNEYAAKLASHPKNDPEQPSNFAIMALIIASALSLCFGIGFLLLSIATSPELHHDDKRPDVRVINVTDNTHINTRKCGRHHHADFSIIHCSSK